MALPALDWKKLPVYTTPSNVANTASVSIILNAMRDMLTGSVYFDGSSRVPGSASAWSVGGRFVTGSNTEAIYCFPPFSGSMSQSVIFAGRNTTGPVSTGTPTLMTYEQTFVSNYIYVGLSIKCPGFVSGSNFFWTGSRPFSGSAASSQSFFSGFGAMTPTIATNQTNYKISIYESQEALCVTMGGSTAGSAQGGCLVGAIIDPQQSIESSSSIDYEVDGRMYAISKVREIGSAFLSTTGYFLGNSTSTSDTAGNYAKFTYFLPNTAGNTNVASNELINNSIYGTNYTSLSGKLVKHPLYVVTQVTYNAQLGSIREIYAIKSTANSLILRDESSNLLGFSVSYLDTAAGHTVLLVP